MTFFDYITAKCTKNIGFHIIYLFKPGIQPLLCCFHGKINCQPYDKIKRQKASGKNKQKFNIKGYPGV